MKRAIVLAGGGSRGSYQIGVWKALKEMDITFDIVTGTSIGALNGAMFVQNDFEQIQQLWETITVEQVMRNGMNMSYDVDYYLEKKDQILPFVKSYFTQKGADIEPLKEIIHNYVNEERFFDSEIDFGMITVKFPSMKPLEILKKDMKPGFVEQWILASASCFPAFPICNIEGENYIDGGYYDNLPIETAFRMGAEEVFAVDLWATKNVRKYEGNPLVKIMEPSKPLGLFLSFDNTEITNNMTLGYGDTLKAFGKAVGETYTFRIDERGQYEEMARRLLLSLMRQELGTEIGGETVLSRFENSTPILSKLIKMNKDKTKSLMDCFSMGIETYMTLYELDSYKIYEMGQVVDEFRNRLNHKAEDELTKRIQRIKRRIQIKGITARMLKEEKNEHVLVALMGAIV